MEEAEDKTTTIIYSVTGEEACEKMSQPDVVLFWVAILAAILADHKQESALESPWGGGMEGRVCGRAAGVSAGEEGMQGTWRSAGVTAVVPRYRVGYWLTEKKTQATQL